MVDSQVLGHRFRKHPGITGAFRVRWEGEDHEVTFRAELVDEYPDTLRLLTFGDPLLLALLGEVQEPEKAEFGLARVATLQPGRPRVGWYRIDDDGVIEVQSYAALQAGLVPTPTSSDLRGEAESAFVTMVDALLSDELEGERRRRREQQSAAYERGRLLLVRAGCLWSARNSCLFGGDLAAVGATTIQQMVAEARYPFAPLASKVGVDAVLSVNSPEWQEVLGKNEKQLEAVWQSLDRETRRVLQQVLDTESIDHPADHAAGVEVEIRLY
jgi:hypothetical protein